MKRLFKLEAMLITGGATLRALDLLVLAVLPVALTALATWVARTAVLTALREAL